MNSRDTLIKLFSEYYHSGAETLAALRTHLEVGIRLDFKYYNLPLGNDYAFYAHNYLFLADSDASKFKLINSMDEYLSLDGQIPLFPEDRIALKVTINGRVALNTKDTLRIMNYYGTTMPKDDVTAYQRLPLANIEVEIKLLQPGADRLEIEQVLYEATAPSNNLIEGMMEFFKNAYTARRNPGSYSDQFYVERLKLWGIECEKSEVAKHLQALSYNNFLVTDVVQLQHLSELFSNSKLLTSEILAMSEHSRNVANDSLYLFRKELSSR